MLPWHARDHLAAELPGVLAVVKGRQKRDQQLWDLLKGSPVWGTSTERCIVCYSGRWLRHPGGT
eukprot:269374-Rhodomonas_salina.2